MLSESMPTYAMKGKVNVSVVETEKRVRHALSEEGFGVLTEIDVSAVFEKKLGKSFRPYRILGACNPNLAHQALSADSDIGLLLPCNLVIQQGADEGTSLVSIMDPVMQLGITGSDSVRPLAEEVRVKLQRVLDAVVDKAV